MEPGIESDGTDSFFWRIFLEGEEMPSNIGIAVLTTVNSRVLNVIFDHC
jgi:hypothetical protein